MARAINLTDDDLRRAFRECALRDTTFEQSMLHPSLSIAIRLKATANLRRQERLADLQRLDRKRAQANDNYDQ